MSRYRMCRPEGVGRRMLGAAAEVEAPRADERRTLKMILGINSQSSAGFQLGRCAAGRPIVARRPNLSWGAALPMPAKPVGVDPRNPVRIVFGRGRSVLK